MYPEDSLNIFFAPLCLCAFVLNIWYPRVKVFLSSKTLKVLDLQQRLHLMRLRHV